MSTLRVDTITDEVGTGPVSFPNGATGVDPFKYNAVSGATQALDLGTYNFFDAGTLTADTTVSFSSVPTEARWTYTANFSALTSYDLTNAAYVRTFALGSRETSPAAVFFKPDGTAMYVVGLINRAVIEYSLPLAWNVSSALYVREFDVGPQENTPEGLFFKPDGTAMYIVGNTDAVHEYSLSTAWNVSTASFVRLFSVLSEESSPNAIFFKPDGTTMYITGSSGDDVNEYSLSTAWDVSTASFVRLFSVISQESSPEGLFFKPDGTTMFVAGVGNYVGEYSLSTAWNVSTASYVRNFSTAAQELPYGLFFKPDGESMYIVGRGQDAIHEYVTADLATITFPSSLQNPFAVDFVSNITVDSQVSYTFFTADGGTNVYLINEEVL